MARPTKVGLDYFPLDVGFFEDKRIRRLASKFGADGPLFYIYILCRAYNSGYAVHYDDDFAEDAALDLHCSTEKIGLMLHYLLDKSLLDSTLFNTVKVLSSHGIQTQYQAVKKSLKRDVEVDGSSWILEKSETEGFIKVRINADKSGINPSKSGINPSKSRIYPQSKVKESKEKERKLEEAYASSCPEPETGSGPPVMLLPLNDGTDYPVTEAQCREWSSLYPAVDVMQQLRSMKGWLIANPDRRKTGKGVARFINSWLSKEQDRGGSRRKNQPSGGGNIFMEMLEEEHGED